MRLIYLLLSTFLVSIGLAAPLINPRAGLTLPGDDPFYTPPSGYENEELGTILRSRKVDGEIGLIDFAVNVESVYQILVHSQDSHNQSNAVVATVFVPYNADPNKIVSYHMAEDTANINCAPSYAMKLDSDILSWITPQVELLLVVPLLHEGYFVVVPDHEGPKSTYAAGYQAGQAILNSIRGTINLGSEIGINENPDVALWGYSGGAFSTSWAAALQPTYAPELNIVGTAMGGVPINLVHLATHCMGNVFSGFMFAAILGLSHEYPELAQEFPKLIYPERLDYLYTAQDHCLVETLAFFAYSTWDEYCVDGIGFLDNPIVADVLGQNNLLNTDLLPDCPFIIYSSVNDEVIPIGDTEELYQNWCSKGINIEYRKDVFSGHIITAIDGVGLAFNFIRDRFNHLELKSPTCQNSTSGFDLFEEGSLAGFGDIALDDIEWIFGKKIGPSSPYSNTTSSSSGPAGSLGLIDTVVNFILQIINSATTPENAANLTTNEIYDTLAGYISVIWDSVSSVYDLVSSIFGFGSSDSTSSNSTSSLVSSLASTLLSTAGSLVSGPSSNSTGSSSSSSGGLLSSLLSTGESLLSGLLGNSTTDGSTSSSLGGSLVSTLLSSGESIVSNLLGDSSSNSTSLSSGGSLSSLLSTGTSLVSSLLSGSS